MFLYFSIHRERLNCVPDIITKINSFIHVQLYGSQLLKQALILWVGQDTKTLTICYVYKPATNTDSPAKQPSLDRAEFIISDPTRHLLSLGL